MQIGSISRRILSEPTLKPAAFRSLGAAATFDRKPTAMLQATVAGEMSQLFPRLVPERESPWLLPADPRRRQLDGMYADQRNKIADAGLHCQQRADHSGLRQLNDAGGELARVSTESETPDKDEQIHDP